MCAFIANAVRHVLGSTDLLTGIAGKPGVGKTTVIRETADAIRALSGQEPMMLAATASAVGRLKEAGMLEATPSPTSRTNPSCGPRRPAE